MTRLLLLLMLLLCAPVTAVAGWVRGEEPVYNGELMVLHWQGADPPVLTVGSFAGTFFFDESSSLGPVLLVGVDIATPAGRYPLQLLTLHSHDQLQVETVPIDVLFKERGVSRITLPPEMVTPTAPAILARINRESEQLRALFAQDSGPLLADLFRRPVPEPVNSRFGKQRILNGEPRAPHSGTDFRSPTGRLVRTPARGRVVFSGDLYYTGNTVILDHGAGLFSLYAHLLKPLCTPGQLLEPGQPLGQVGSTGRSTGAHLHWTVQLRGARIDPMTLLSRFGAKTP